MAINNEGTDDEESPSEQSPLLQSEEILNLSEPTLIPQLHSPRIVILLLALLVFVLMFGSSLMITPSMRIYEDIICHHFYDNIKGKGHVALNADIDEKLCKGKSVQEELAIVMGGMQVADTAPGKHCFDDLKV